jgi:BlaI family transcriptional regulator, penicillinase repressor
MYVMKDLTRAEEQIMQVLWKLKKGFVKDILEQLPEPKPAYNTVSTVVRILEKKGFVSYTAFGKTHEYYPLIQKKEYTRNYLRNFVGNYFSHSYKQLVSFFAEEDLTISEMEELQKLIKQQIEKQKAGNHE